MTAVDSTGKMDMLRSIGAQHVIDYTMETTSIQAPRTISLSMWWEGAQSLAG